MRSMTDQEIKQAIDRCRWATICTVTEEGFPYAIEATPFDQGGETCFMINPRGLTWKNISRRADVFLKYTLASPDLAVWAGVSGFGTGRFVEDENRIREGWSLLGQVLGTDFSKAADRFSQAGKRSPLFAVSLEKYTGRCSMACDEPFVWP